MVNLFESIINDKNLREAYLEVYQNFIEKCRVYKYDVMDAQQIHQTELYLPEFLAQIRQEMVEGSRLRPAHSIFIPKKNGKLRKVYKLAVKERIKCQAIYRVLQEFLKPHYSKYLYSFRSERPSYYALRSLRRFYLAQQNKGFYVLKTDFKDYSDHIDKNILAAQLTNLGVDDQTIKLINRFSQLPFIREGELSSMHEGIMQGIPLVSLFDNIYMSEIDDQLGQDLVFYRRVGDDIIGISNDLDQLQKSLIFIKNRCKIKKIILNEQKTLIQPLEEYFEYLGLAFHHGEISIPVKKVQLFYSEIKKNLQPSSRISWRSKIAKIRKFLVINHFGHSAYLDSFILPHNLVTATEHIQKISFHLMKIVWAYLGGGFTSQKISIGKKLLCRTKLPMKSFFKQFSEISFEPERE